MSTKLFSKTLLRVGFLFCLEFLVSFVQTSQAADALNYFKNYFITGDYVAAGVGLRGLGIFSPALGGYFATGTINIGGAGPNGSDPVPVTNGVPAEIVAAFLYWETEESAPAPVAMKGFFDGHPIVGKVLGNPNNPACWSSGGTSGSTVASGRVYRADVLRYLPVDHINNVRIANGPHTVSLADSGGTGNGNVLLTDGASLVVIYRIVVPGQPLIAPLRSVVLYDGTYTMSKGSAPMTQTIGGFYQASPNAEAKMTPIVANGQAGFVETLTVNGLPLKVSPFTGTAGVRWDNPTIDMSLAKDAASYSTQVTSSGNQVCLTFGAIVTSTNVTDWDSDGLLDTWEMNGLHLNTGGPGQPATFGGCADFPKEPCVNLPAMGADPNKKDIFVEIDWMHGADGHLHIPKYDALNAIGLTFLSHAITLHFDVGPNYQGSPFIVPAAYAQGGEVIEESSLLCPNAQAAVCAFSEPYAVVGWKKGLHAVKDGLPSLGIPQHFVHPRKDVVHYVSFGHALAGPFENGKPLSRDPSSVSGVADRPGGDVMVTLGLWRYDDAPGCDLQKDCADQTGSALVQAGTLMHELGHNLGLSHAGLYRLPNCMPNYPSVMNYLYQTRGLTDAAGLEHIDFSSGLLSPLDENSLPKLPGAMGLLNYRVRFYGSPTATEGAAKVHCDGTPITNGAVEVRLESAGTSTPDWNRTGRSDDGPVSSDVNFNGSIEDGVGGGKFFLDTNDWGSLNLQQIGARENVGGLSGDVGDADLGDADLGDADLGDADLGDADLGDADLGDADLGDMSFDTAISSIDATSTSQPLKATNQKDRITLSWGGPGIGQIRTYSIYRSDAVHAPVLIANVNGAPPATTYDDVVNDFADAGASCPVKSTCYNTAYTYFLTATDVLGTTSNNSSTASGEVTQIFHLFVIADNQNIVYGAALPALTFQVFGDGSALLDRTKISCAILPAPEKYNVGTYPITCSGPASPSPSVTVTYNAPYNDGITLHTPGILKVTPAPLTITALTNTKQYDATTSAAAIPSVSGLKGTDTVTGLAEAYDTADVGTNKALSVSAYTLNDGNGGLNYTVSTNSDKTGVITKANALIVVIPYNVFADGAAHTATGTATGVGGVDLSANLNLTGTAHTLAGDYSNDPWSFSGGKNYNDAYGAVHDHLFQFVATGSMSTPRSFHTATLLGNGKVLVVGGFDDRGAPLASAELYDPNLKTFSPTTNNMPNKAAGHTATLLLNGQVLVVGGGNSSSEIYDPPSNTWKSAGGISGQRSYHTATLLPNGQVLIAGGSDQSGKTTSSAILYDPATGAYTNTGNMTASRDFHTATLLPNGKVLIAGGRTSNGPGYTYQATAEIYDPVAGTFTATGSMSLSLGRYGHSAVSFNGKVLIAGGANSTVTATAESYDPSTGEFSPTGNLGTARQFLTATIFNSSVVEAGGTNGTTLSSAEQYQGSLFQSAGNMKAPRAAHTATVLVDGSVLITGGQNNGSSVSSAEILK